MSRSRRIFIYVQGLSGTGHFVRMFEVARALQPAHEVLLLDGGRPIARPEAPVRRLVVPGVYRGPDGRLATTDGAPVDRVLEERRAALARALARLRPDVVLVEDFPFSKWEMAAEIFHVLEQARASGVRPRVVCCVRDIGTRNRRPSDAADHPGLVRRTLREHFDLVLAHADPAIVRLEEHLPWATHIDVPLRYTGYVSQKPAADEMPGPRAPAPAAHERVRVVVSAGGAASSSLIPLALRAWPHLLPRLRAPGAAELIVFLPAYATHDELTRWRREVQDPTIDVRPFSADFLAWLGSADVSISHAGYNTCTNIMETRTPAILLPNRGMSDQPLRAGLLARLGLAVVADIDAATPEDLGAAVERQLRAKPARPAIDLSGAQTARALVEQLAGTMP